MYGGMDDFESSMCDPSEFIFEDGALSLQMTWILCWDRFDIVWISAIC